MKSARIAAWRNQDFFNQSLIRYISVYPHVIHNDKNKNTSIFNWKLYIYEISF